jgi:excisionase family DNA binding protein
VSTSTDIRRGRTTPRVDTRKPPISVPRLNDGKPPRITVARASALGFGHPQTIRRYIHEGRLPAEKVGRDFLIYEDDLRGLFRTIPPSKVATEEYLDSLVKQMVDKWPLLTQEHKRELGQLLAPSAT